MVAGLRQHGLARSPARGLVWWYVVVALVSGSAAQAREIVGWVEYVQLGLDGEIVRAKVDTGADHSSLDARNIRIFTRHGGDWVRFERVRSDGRTSVHELPLVRRAHIRRHEGESEGRPVVALGICLGGYRRIAEVNLVNRARFEYPMLIGRSFLANDFLVDPGATLLLEPRCEPRD